MKTKRVYVLFVETDIPEELEKVDRGITFLTSDEKGFGLHLPISPFQEKFNFSWKVKYWLDSTVSTIQNFFKKFENLHLYIF